jgi:Transposase domain (DUF772)
VCRHFGGDRAATFAFEHGEDRGVVVHSCFADLFPSGRGRPSVPADVMASVITLQALHGLSDAETVDAVTFDLRWKAACGLPVSAAAFQATTLTYWRRRVAASERLSRIFDVVKAVVAEIGVLTGKTRRALDSTILDDAVATQDTVTQLNRSDPSCCANTHGGDRRSVPSAAEHVGCSAPASPSG